MVDINPSSHRPSAEIIKMASNKPIMQSMIDWFGHADDWLIVKIEPIPNTTATTVSHWFIQALECIVCREYYEYIKWVMSANNTRMRLRMPNQFDAVSSIIMVNRISVKKWSQFSS